MGELGGPRRLRDQDSRIGLGLGVGARESVLGAQLVDVRQDDGGANIHVNVVEEGVVDALKERHA